MMAKQRRPIHPGEMLRDLLPSFGISKARLARDIGISYMTLYQIITGKGSITPKTAVRLSSYLGGEAETWLSLQAKYDLWCAERLIGNNELEQIKRRGQQSDAYRSSRL